MSTDPNRAPRHRSLRPSQPYGEEKGVKTLCAGWGGVKLGERPRPNAPTEECRSTCR